MFSRAQRYPAGRQILFQTIGEPGLQTGPDSASAGSGGFGLSPIIGEIMAEWIHKGSVTENTTENFKLYNVRRYCPDQPTEVTACA